MSSHSWLRRDARRFIEVTFEFGRQFGGVGGDGIDEARVPAPEESKTENV
jgi:hypothetical protein